MRCKTGRIAYLRVLGVIALLPAFAIPAQAGQKVLTGTVAYDGGISLPSDALLEVRLVDKSLPGVAPQLVARSTQPVQGDPVAFELGFEETDILAGHRYAIDARIGSKTAIWFASDSETLLEPLSAHYPIDLEVGMIAAPPAAEEQEQKSQPAQTNDFDTDDNSDN